MTKQPSLDDIYVNRNILGEQIISNAEIMAWNDVWLILLALASLLALINRLDVDSKTNNLYEKLSYGGLSVVALAGLFYPIEFGLLGVNIILTVLLVVDFFRYDKTNKKNKW